MKTYLTSLLLISSLGAHASLEERSPFLALSDKSEASEDKSYFEQLGDLYGKGSRPELARISNVAWSGRCFMKKNPNEPENAGYIVRRVRGSDRSHSNFEAFSYWQTSEAPNYFDDKNVEKVFELLPNLKAFPIEMRITSLQINLDANTKSNLRVSGDYLIEQISGSKQDLGPIGGVEVGVRCYYFIPDLN